MAGEKEGDGDFITILVAFALLGVTIYLVYRFQYHLVAGFWLMLRSFQFMLLSGVEFSVNLLLQGCIEVLKIFGANIGKYEVDWGFTKEFKVLTTLPRSAVSPAFTDSFDTEYGNRLKYFAAVPLIWIGVIEFRKTWAAKRVPPAGGEVEYLIRKNAKYHPHLWAITPLSPLEKLLQATVGRVFPQWLRPPGENPMDHSHEYNFSNRSDEENRYAMGVSPTEMLNANPPLGVNQSEIDADKKMQDKYGFNSSFRPICNFYYDDEGKGRNIDFCQRTATNSLQRLMLRTLGDAIDDLSLVARVFDETGQLVPLTYQLQDGSVTKRKKLKRKELAKAKVIDGYRKSTLLNNGNEYHGTVQDVMLLFNANERKVLEVFKSNLKAIFKGNKTSFEDVLYLTVKEKHAFSHTVIQSMMLQGKTRTKITGDEFSWVTKHDRTLGLLLQSVGREVPFWEAAGAWAHYKIESSAGIPIKQPEVQLAVEALYEEAKRIQNAGLKSEDLFTKGQELIARLDEGVERKADEVRSLVNAELKAAGIDVDDTPDFKDPWEDYDAFQDLKGELDSFTEVLPTDEKDEEEFA